MVSLALELTGISLSVLGWLLSVVSCALPMWRVSAFIGANIVTAQVYWEGLWMSCVFQSTGQMQCKVYDSMLALPQDLQSARALTVISIILGLLALLISMVGAKCTNCIEAEGAKARVMAASGGAFITAALTQLVPVSWSAHTIIIEFYSPIVPEGQKMEIGAALYLGWAAAALLLVGGSILCCSCPPQEEKPMRYSIHPQSRIAYSAAPRSASRAMMIIAIILGVLGVLISIVGAKCTNCIDDEPSKAKVMIIAGIFFILGGLLVLIPVSWTASVIIRDFYNPLLISAQRRELGASLYIGWGTAALLLIGGAMLCSSCPPKEKKYKPPRMAYSAPRSTSAGGGYDRKDYV
ncbi:claudin-3-like isoform X2 [Scomber japonicus]|uniref:claudin-3-like isoform X2 n=1 Tax=Scomber japonicus TaxID=13676 RepID=UPI002305F4E3|nr:claudin-3-like isoform X2 [Scomber japonicus]